MAITDNFEKMLAAGKDSPLLRFSLGNEYLKAGEATRAVAHLAEAVRQNPRYSAAWKLYGKALTEVGDAAAAMAAYREGIAAAEAQGDKQAAKEMVVFLRRLEKTTGRN
ncbi:MAG TPA: tetratricopeptide repeat protein [Usitatibacteraceae bacterium]|nr:tetratricopeptide repeat protein [Usitatibacteraceae bacterium]